MLKKKLLYIVLDGLGDRPIKALGGKTPLEAAHTPNLDGLASRGRLGLVHTVGENIAPESDVAVISILGYEADKYYTGRGPLECFAEGLKVNDGDLAYRVNFATKDNLSDKIIDRRVGRNLTTEEATGLSEEVNKKVKLDSASFIFKNTIGHRGVLVISNGGNLSAGVTNTDPAYEKEGVYGVAKEKFENVVMECRPSHGFENDPMVVSAARLTNEFVRKSTLVLNDSEINKKRLKEGRMPGNLILTRDGGDRLPKFPKMKDRYGLEFGCFVEMPVEKGIALLLGMAIVNLPLSTKDLDKDYALRAQKAVEAIKKYDALYIHIKGPDEPAHDGDFNGKLKTIEAIDRAFFGNLIRKIDFEKNVMAVTADHSTPCRIKAHSSDPVPLLIHTAGIKPDGLGSFGEGAAAKGSLGTLKGHELMALFTGYME